MTHAHHDSPEVSADGIIHERFTVAPDVDEVVVFLIGMRIHTWWKVWAWLPVALAMGRMLRELHADPALGLLGTRGTGPGVIVQYWRDFDSLVDYASNQHAEHYPAWKAFNQKLRKTGDVGIWHETFVIPAANIEALYHHMPPTGLAEFMPRQRARGHTYSARDRMGDASDKEDTAPHAA